MPEDFSVSSFIGLANSLLLVCFFILMYASHCKAIVKSKHLGAAEEERVVQGGATRSMKGYEFYALQALEDE